jgi:hypothetical protein
LGDWVLVPSKGRNFSLRQHVHDESGAHQYKLELRRRDREAGLVRRCRSCDILVISYEVFALSKVNFTLRINKRERDQWHRGVFRDTVQAFTRVYPKVSGLSR